MIEFLKKYPLIIVGVIILFWGLSGFIAFNFVDKPGEFGDMFGAINALFSGLALFGIIMSILFQQTELEYQREELIETRLVFQVNRINNVIYNQLERLEKSISAINFGDPYNKEVGRTLRLNFINFAYNESKYQSKFSKQSQLESYNENKGKTIFKEIVKLNKTRLNDIVSKVFRTSKIIRKLISNESIPLSEKSILKMLFFDNLEPELNSMMLNMDEYLSEKIINDYFSPNGAVDLDISDLRRNLTKIIDFKNQNY